MLGFVFLLVLSVTVCFSSRCGAISFSRNTRHLELITYHMIDSDWLHHDAATVICLNEIKKKIPTFLVCILVSINCHQFMFVLLCIYFKDTFNIDISIINSCLFAMLFCNLYYLLCLTMFLYKAWVFKAHS